MKKSICKIFSTLLLLLFLMFNVLTVYASSASGGGGGGGSSSRSSSASGGGGGSSSSSSGASGGGGGSSSSSNSGGSSSSRSSGGSSGGGGSSIISSGTISRGGAGGGGGGGSDDLTDTNDSTNGNSNSSYTISARSSGGGGGGNHKRELIADATNLSGYTPTEDAVVTIDNNSNVVGSMVTNGDESKFVITSENGNATSKYLTDWAVITTTDSQGWYHFDDSGKMTTGFYDANDGNTYYMMEDGENKGMLAVGSVEINGTTYNFSDGQDGRPYGAMIK